MIQALTLASISSKDRCQAFNIYQHIRSDVTNLNNQGQKLSTRCVIYLEKVYTVNQEGE